MAETWTIAAVLQWTQARFKELGIDSPRLDAELLLAHALGKSRVYLYTHYDQPLTSGERDTYRALVQRRQRREPVAYILGEREFYGLTFAVNKDVLVPRPETEHLVDAVREWAGTRAVQFCDVGTGSGAIVVSLLKMMPDARAIGLDLSKAALEVTRANAIRHAVVERLELRESDLFAAMADETSFDVIVANPPYVAVGEREQLMPEVRCEPELALYGGSDGLDVIRRLLPEALVRLARPGLLAMEIGAGQWPAVKTLTTAFDDVRVAADLAGHPRVVLATLRA